MSKKNKDRRRKLTDERVERINRQRTFHDGGEPSFEVPLKRIILDSRGRAVEVEYHGRPLSLDPEQ